MPAMKSTLPLLLLSLFSISGDTLRTVGGTDDCGKLSVFKAKLFECFDIDGRLTACKNRAFRLSTATWQQVFHMQCYGTLAQDISKKIENCFNRHLYIHGRLVEKIETRMTNCVVNLKSRPQSEFR